MSSSNKLGQKNPLLQRVRRHSEMALLFRSPGLGYAPTWTAEIANPTAPQAEALPFSQEMMVETRPFSTDTPSIPQPTTMPPTVQRQSARQSDAERHPTPTLWQRAKTLFRQESTSPPPAEAANHNQTIEPSARTTSHQPPATSTDTYGIMQRQPAAHIAATPQAPTSAQGTAVPPIVPATINRSAHTPGDTYIAVAQRQPISNQLSLPSNQSPISRSEATQSRHRPITPDSDFPWSPLQAIYSSHHPDTAQKASAVHPTTITPPTVQRQATPPAAPIDGSFPWGALQNIYDVHQKVAHQEKEASLTAHTEEVATPSFPAEPHLPEQSVPLQDIWPVETTTKSETTAVAQPNQSSTTPIQRTAADQVQDAQVRAKLDAVTPARPSDSSVELVTPRRPRPTVSGKTAVTPTSPKRSIQRKEKAQPSKPVTELPNPTIETEIGPLPADLWDYLGPEPPTAVPTTTDQSPSKPGATKSTTNSAVQRAIAQAEAPVTNEHTEDDMPLPTTSLMPLADEPVATAVLPTIQRQTDQGTPTQTGFEESHAETAVPPTSTTQQKEQNRTSASTSLQTPISVAPNIQRAVAFAEASPTRQEQMINHSPTAEPMTTTKTSQPQTSIAQPEIDNPQTAETALAAVPTTQSAPPPTHSQTVVAPVTLPMPTPQAATVQRATQSATNQLSPTEIMSNPDSVSLATPVQEATETTAVPQPPIPQPAISTQTKQSSSEPYPTQTAATPSTLNPQPFTTSTQPDIAQAEKSSNGRSIHRQTEQKTAVQPATPDLTDLSNQSGLTETIQRAIATAEVAPVTLDHQTSQQPPTTGTNSIIKENSAGQGELATSHQTPTIQREEVETAVSPNLPSSSPQPSTTEQQETAEPDINELARQVYSDLKRRLTVEWERNRGRLV